MARLAPQAEANTRKNPYNDRILQELKERRPTTQLWVWKNERSFLKYLAYSILGSDTEVEMLLADVFCDFFYHHVDSMEKANAVRAYLRIMVIRRARRFKQNQRLHFAVESELDYPVAQDSELSTQLDHKLCSRWLTGCVGKLTPRSRTVLSMYYSQGKSLSEIGAHLGRSRQSVHRILTCCHASLRKCLLARRKETALSRKYHAHPESPYAQRVQMDCKELG